MELWETLIQLVTVLGRLVVELLFLALSNALLIVYLAWWLWAVNWQKLWPVLARGGWLPLVLLIPVGAMLWSQIAPSPLPVLGINIPNFWWQLDAVGLLVAGALFCGWLQGVFRWAPPEIDLEPPAPAGHGH